MSTKRPLSEASASASTASTSADKKAKPREVFASNSNVPRGVGRALYGRFLDGKVADDEAFTLTSGSGVASRVHSYVLVPHPFFEILLSGNFRDVAPLKVEMDTKTLAKIVEFICTFARYPLPAFAWGPVS